MSLVCREGPRCYFGCDRCDLRFLHPHARLGPKQEKARYLLHDNDIGDPKYREFVRPLYEQVRQHVELGTRGLDFGSGTGPVLADMLRGEGYQIRLFDPFFRPDAEALRRTYQFIVACEVMEHVFDPGTEFRRLKRMLFRDGLLGVMTLRFDDKTDFATWYYRRDPTHVAFYSRATFHWIQRVYSFSRIEFPSDRITLLWA